MCQVTPLRRVLPQVTDVPTGKHAFILIASGQRTTEIRVNDSSRRKIKPGSLIRFKCRDEEILTRVTKVTHYASFEEMFDTNRSHP